MGSIRSAFSPNAVRVFPRHQAAEHFMADLPHAVRQEQHQAVVFGGAQIPDDLSDACIQLRELQ